MATHTEVLNLRRLINDNEEPFSYSENDLMIIIDAAEGDLDKSAAVVWEQKAASFSTMVNVSESGSSRSMGDLYKNALEQARYYKSKSTPDPGASQRTRVSRITRG